ncbi:PepSY-associated TM helix domain-containing protein [Rheinheimera tilapiae]|uniref:PepSY-associated TM helix domain-containing protein n=1 Tax=Rheinheimera tilapiae TaxID=875043 RepID=A0ABV6BJF9_9GAMM
MSRVLRWLHIYVSMTVLVVFVFFALTGITLNHPDWQLDAGKQSDSRQLQLPAALTGLEFSADQLQQAEQAKQIADWLRAEHQIQGAVFAFSYDPDEQLLELDFKQPAGFANAQIALDSGVVELTAEFGGYLALLNDLHKGRYAGTAWKWLIDVVAIACLVFALSGFYLLWRQPARRWLGVQCALTGAGVMLLVYLAALH